ncbi:MAG: hypothetical protein KDA96_08070 [Planctomycetaceae bacterium]|nr:hypothetical protein [Planctomycetaceae bacterium]
MKDRISRFFSRDNPERKASCALARILSQFDMETLSYREGIADSRRNGDPRYVALGVWIIPCDSAQQDLEKSLDQMFDGVTFDLRRNGIGVLTRRSMPQSRVIIALPDKDNVWRFFQAIACHQSARPGGWVLAGFRVERVVELDNCHLVRFRNLIGENVPEETVAATDW